MANDTDGTRDSHAHSRMGMVLVAAAAFLFATKGIFSKALYQRGVGFELLVTVRALLAMPLFVWFGLRAGAGKPLVVADEEAPTLAVAAAPLVRPRLGALAAAALAGIICYYVGALVDFKALTLIDASIERVLLFSYPALVVMLGSILKRRAPERRVVAAMVVTYLGIWLVMGGIDMHELRANLYGAALVLVAAFTTAIYFLISERYTRELGSTRFASVAMSASAVVLLVHFACFGSWAEVVALGAHEWLLLAVLAIACMFVPGLLQAEGVRRVGAQRAAIASTIGPPTTILLAAIFFAERLNAWQWLGSGLIVVSVLVLTLGKTSAR